MNTHKKGVAKQIRTASHDDQQIIRPLMPKKSRQASSVSFNKSTYQRNTNAFSMIQNELASGKSKWKKICLYIFDLNYERDSNSSFFL